MPTNGNGIGKIGTAVRIAMGVISLIVLIGGMGKTYGILGWRITQTSESLAESIKVVEKEVKPRVNAIDDRVIILETQLPAIRKTVEEMRVGQKVGREEQIEMRTEVKQILNHLERMNGDRHD